MAVLPPEIWRQISSHLEKHDLSALSRISHKYQEIVAPFFYSSLRIQFRDLETLQKAVNGVLERPGQLFLKYARVLDIVCVQPPWLDTEKSQELWGLKDWGTEYVHWEEPATIRNAFLEHQLHSSSCARGIGFPLCELGSYCPGDSVQGWAPVAELISRLNHLEELNFVADNTAFVSTLLEAITAHHPACCLNIWSHQEVEASRKSLTETDDTRFDLNTLRSKALRALAVTIDRKFSDDDGYDQVDEMLPFLFTGANLKHLIISVTSGPRSDIEQSKREWAEAARALQPTSSAQLESLTLRDHVSPVYLLPKFASIIDLSRLRSLDITPAEDTRLFLDFAQELTTLERLFIGVSPLRLPDISTAHVYTDNAEAISAVLAFKPLKYLCLRGLREASNLHRITTHHGPTLRGLILEPYARDNNIGAAYGSFIYPKLGPSNIRLLAKHCPDLKELRLQLRRSEGDSHECDIYRAFGHFQKLRRLILDLHFDPRERGVNPESLDTMYPEHSMEAYIEEDKIDPALFRTTLINAATDETLALSIWNLIASSQTSNVLQSLRIVPFGHDMYPMDVSFYLIFLARSFLVSKLGVADPVVEEIGKMAWKVWQEDSYGAGGPCVLPDGADEVVGGLWPALVGREDWSSGWDSLPLQTGTT